MKNNVLLLNASQYGDIYSRIRPDLIKTLRSLSKTTRKDVEQNFYMINVINHHQSMS